MPALGLATVLTLTACSGGGTDEGPGSGPSRGGDAGRATETVATQASLGKVRGRVGDARAAEVLAEVTAAVDAWIDGAYAGDYPRADFAAGFTAFTADARRLALGQPAVMSNAEIGRDLDRVEVSRREVRVDLLGADGDAAGATARVDLVLDLTGAVERTDSVTGRLLLTPAKDGWKVFGFDVRRGEGGL